MKCQNLFSGINKKKIIQIVIWIFYPAFSAFKTDGPILYFYISAKFRRYKPCPLSATNNDENTRVSGYTKAYCGITEPNTQEKKIQVRHSLR